MKWLGGIFAAAVITIAFAFYSDMTLKRCEAMSFAALVGLCSVTLK
jgi:hypothetical protein